MNGWKGWPELERRASETPGLPSQAQSSPRPPAVFDGLIDPASPVCASYRSEGGGWVLLRLTDVVGPGQFRTGPQMFSVCTSEGILFYPTSAVVQSPSIRRQAALWFLSCKTTGKRSGRMLS